MIKEVFRNKVSSDSNISFNGEKYNKILLYTFHRGRTGILAYFVQGGLLQLDTSSFKGSLEQLFILNNLRKYRLTGDVNCAFIPDNVFDYYNILQDKNFSDVYCNSFASQIHTCSDFNMRVKLASDVYAIEVVLLYDDSLEEEPVYKMMSVIENYTNFNCSLNSNAYILPCSYSADETYFEFPRLIADGVSYSMLDLTHNMQFNEWTGGNPRTPFYGWVVPKCNSLSLVDWYSYNVDSLWVEF